MIVVSAASYVVAFLFKHGNQPQKFFWIVLLILGEW